MLSRFMDGKEYHYLGVSRLQKYLILSCLIFFPGCFLFGGGGDEVSFGPADIPTECSISPTTNSPQIVSNNHADYLYQDLTITPIVGENGPSFRVLRNGKVLREYFSDEKFFQDYTGGALSISYTITPKTGGVDINYTLSNASGEPQFVPVFRVDGFIPATSDDLCYLNIRESGTLEMVHPSWNEIAPGPYPDGAYSAVNVMQDNQTALGSTLLFPVMNYQHTVHPKMEKIESGIQQGTWRHMFARGPGTSMVPSGETWNYILTIRFSEKRYWLYTLHPYKTFFQAQNLNYSDLRVADRRPVNKQDLSNKGQWNAETNPRGYNEDLLIHSDGFGPFVNSSIEEMQESHFERIIIFRPSGNYHTSNGSIGPCSFPPQFMDFHPDLVDSAEEFFGHYANPDPPYQPIQLGFWYGRAGQFPSSFAGDNWDPLNCVPSTPYTNPEHHDFHFNQMQKAYDLGARAIGFDLFAKMAVWARMLLVDEYKETFPLIEVYVHEGAASDILHGKIGNYYTPNRWGRCVQFGPDLLSRYVGNGDSEIWVTFRCIDYPYTQEVLQNHIQWGFTPVISSVLSQYDLPNIDYSLTQCFDGVDNDGDGAIDFPQDLGCLNAADQTE